MSQLLLFSYSNLECNLVMSSWCRVSSWPSGKRISTFRSSWRWLQTKPLPTSKYIYILTLPAGNIFRLLSRLSPQCILFCVSLVNLGGLSHYSHGQTRFVFCPEIRTTWIEIRTMCNSADLLIQKWHSAFWTTEHTCVIWVFTLGNIRLRSRPHDNTAGLWPQTKLDYFKQHVEKKLRDRAQADKWKSDT